MTDGLMAVNNHFGHENGRNPLTQMAKVIMNGYYDEESSQRAKIALAHGRSLYPGPIDDATTRICPRDLVWRDKSHASARRKNHQTSPFVVASLNGAFDADSDDRVEDRIEFIGVAAGQGHETSQDARHGYTTQVAFSIQIGGTVTIVNNSNQAIPNNSLVVWHAPDPHADDPLQIVDVTRKGWDRITLQTRAYDPTKDTISADTAGAAIRARERNRTEKPKRRDVPSLIQEGSGILFDGLLDAIFVAIWTLRSDLGIGEIGADVLANKLGISDAPNVNEANRTKLMEKLFPLRPSDYLSEGSLDLSGTKRVAPTGVAGKLLFKTQRRALEAIIAGAKHCDKHMLRRIIGCTLSGAAPRADMDIMLGKYAI